MTTNFVKSTNVVKTSFNLSGKTLRVMLLALLPILAVCNVWAGDTYYAKLTVTAENTAAGLVYANHTDASPADSQFAASATADDENSQKNTAVTYYMWAKPKRGAEFSSWTMSGNQTSGPTYNATNGYYTVKITKPSSDGTTNVTAKANWTTYTAATVTYQTPIDGSYEIQYQYTEYNSTNKTFDQVDRTIVMAEGATAHSETSYQNDVITLKTSATNFEGWYSDVGYSTPLPGSYTDKTYTYIAPNGGSASIYAKFKHTPKFYGRLTAKLAPSSPADGGALYASQYSTMEGAVFSMADRVVNQIANAADEFQTSADQTYYLHALATDSRYKFRGWYSDEACTSLLSTNVDYTYTFLGVSSTDPSSPDEVTVYACFERACSHFLQVDAMPAVAGLGMVHTHDAEYSKFPHYKLFENVASQTVIVTSTNTTTNGTVYLYAQPKYGYKFTGWYVDATCTGSAASTANPYAFSAPAISTDPLLPTKHVFYAKFEPDAMIDVTYKLPTNGAYTASLLDIIDEDGEYIWGQTQVYSSAGKMTDVVVRQCQTDYLTLSATPSAGYKVTQWKDGDDIIATASWVHETKVNASKVFGVTFATTQPYKVGSNLYTDLNSAISAAGSSGTIIVVEDAYVPAGTYTIPSGVKLFVPYNDGYTQYGGTAGVQPYGTDKKVPSVYKKLTLGDNTHIIVNGTIEVGGIQNLGGQHGAGCGIPDVAYGQIEMLEGSTITLNNGSKLYAWGHITGKFVNGKYQTGTLTAKNGATVKEYFQIMDYKGGTITSNVGFDLFPMTQYYIQNIQSPITFEYGAKEQLFGGVTASKTNYPIKDMNFINTSGGMFNITSAGSSLCKEYDPLTDRLICTMVGDASINDISLSVAGTTVSSANYRLPLTNNITVKVLSGTTTLNTNGLELTADTEINIAKGAKVQVGSSSSTSHELILIDKNEWGNFCNTGVKIYPLKNVPLRQFTRTGDNLRSARLKVQGILDVYGSLYTTASGAVINSEGYSGQINLNKKAPNQSTVKHTNNGQGSIIEHPITAAQLLNSDNTFTQTAESAAGSVFYYIRGLWMRLSQDGCFYKDPQNHLFIHTNDGDFMEVLDASPTYTAAYRATDCADLVYVHTANNCTWVPTHTVADNATLLKGMDGTYYKYGTSEGYWIPAPSFTVTFKNFNDKVLETVSIYEGGTPVYTGYTPVRPEDDDWRYTFSGWSPEIVAATGNASYTAQYDKVSIKHILTWNPDGGVLSGTYTSGLVKAGTWIIEPTATRVNYVFSGWSPTVGYVMPDHDITYTAQWLEAEASVTISGETTYYLTFSEAFAAAQEATTSRITVLKDVSGITSSMAYTKNSGNCTLDLNNHTVSGTVSKLIDINAAGSTFTITDNSEEKNGALRMNGYKNERQYCVYVTDGALVQEHGTIYAENTYTYNSSSAKKTTASAVYVTAGKEFTMNGGTAEAQATYNPITIFVAGSTSADAIVNLNAGTINATSTVETAPRGVYCAGGTTYIKDGIIINSTSKKTDARGIHVEANKAGYFGTLNMSGGEVNVLTTTSGPYGVFVNRATTDDKLTVYKAVANISGGTFNVTSTTTASSSQVADGIRSYGTTTISGSPEFNVTATSTYAWGVRIIGGTTTISGSPHFTVSATSTSYGIQVAPSAAEATTGLKYDGSVIVNGGTFDVSTRTSTTAYGVYVLPPAPTIIADGEYAGTYNSIASATINDGTFNVTAKTTTVTGVFVDRKLNADNLTVNRGTVEITGGNFTVKALTQKDNTKCDGVRTYGPTTITGGIFNVQASNSSTAKNATSAWGIAVVDGTTTIGTSSVANKPEFTVKAYGTAYGIQATADAANATTGLEYHSDVTINNGKFDVSTTTGATAYGVLASGIAPRVIASGDYAGTYYSSATVTVNDGTFNVTTKTTSAYGVYSGRSYTNAKTEPNTFSNYNYSTVNVHGGTFNVTATTNTAMGAVTHGYTNIDGGTFIVRATDKTVYGIRGYAGKTTVDNTNNPSFNVQTKTVAYGATCGEAPDSKIGLTYNGELEINGGEFTVKTTNDKTAYGVYVYAKTTPISTTNATDSKYYAGNYASAGTAKITGGVFDITSKKTDAYGIVVAAGVSESSVAGYDPASATPTCVVEGGKFKVTGTAKYAVNAAALPANFTISGGYWGGDGVNTNLATYAVSPQKVITLRSTNANYTAGYRYTVGQGGTVTWKNGSTTLDGPTVYEKGETPVYGGATPTKAEDASYTYTHSGWDPVVAAMDNSDVTYTATFSSTPRTYTVTLHPNDGTINSGNVAKYTYATGVTLPTDITRSGYNFDGWYDNAEFTGSAVTEISSAETGNKEYWAKWITDRELDIIEWTTGASGSIKINGNGLRAETPGTGTNWAISVDGSLADYKKGNRNSTTRVLEITGLNLTSGQKLRIRMKDKDGKVESSHYYNIPYINEIPSSGTNNVVYIKNETSVDATSKPKLAALYINPGAKLTITDGTLQVGKLVLRTRPWESAIIEGDFEADKIYYTRIGANGETVKGYDGTETYTYTPSSYYLFGLPSDCEVDDVILSNGNKPIYGTDWVLKSYNEESRATNGKADDGSNWNILSSSATIKGGVGYEMMSVSTYYQEFYFPIDEPSETSVIIAYTSEGAREGQSGWNYVTSPLMTSIANAAEPEGLPISWLDENGTYRQGQATSVPPARPFSFQAEGEGAISFTDGTINFVPKQVSPVVRRRIAAREEKTKIQWIHLDLKDMNNQGDEATIYSHPTRYDEAYQMGIDVEKQSLTAPRVLLYSSHAYGDMAFAGVADSQLEQGISLTVYSPGAQELMISMRENDWLNRMEHVWLIDNETGMRVDLLESDYAFRVPEGTTRGRLFIQGQFKAPNVITDIEGGAGIEGELVRKVMIDQKIYILVGERMYDATGKLVLDK